MDASHEALSDCTEIEKLVLVATASDLEKEFRKMCQQLVRCASSPAQMEGLEKKLERDDMKGIRETGQNQFIPNIF